jgi:hypothetical protein
MHVGLAVGGEGRDVGDRQQTEPMKLGRDASPLVGRVSGQERRRLGHAFANLRLGFAADSPLAGVPAK